MRTTAIAGVLFFALVAATTWAGCANDFDALFATNAKADAGPIVLPDAASDAQGSGGGSAEGGAVCAPVIPACNENACTGENCENSCAGCGCTCSKFDCSRGRADICSTTCSGGAKCNVGCDINGPCTLTAHGTTSAAMVCGEDVAACTGNCDQGGACDVTCQNKGFCSLVCAAGSSCLLRCSDRAINCTLDCQGGERKECGDKVFTCNRDCP